VFHAVSKLKSEKVYCKEGIVVSLQNASWRMEERLSVEGNGYQDEIETEQSAKDENSCHRVFIGT
jgi:hypothetical protein